MKHFVLILFAITATAHAIEIPKSSLEGVRQNTLERLKAAKASNNHQLINQYETELKTLEFKIKQFELEWLKYRKTQLAAKKDAPGVVKERAEVEQLIKARAS